MRLVFMRHAKSDWTAGMDDHDRPLNARGRAAAGAMGRLLTRIGEVPDLVLTSSAERAVATARLAAEGGGWTAPIRIDPTLYHPSPAAVARAVAADRGVARLMVVGHEPTWSRVVADLTGAKVAMRTATVAVVEDGELLALLQARHFTGSAD